MAHARKQSCGLAGKDALAVAALARTGIMGKLLSPHGAMLGKLGSHVCLLLAMFFGVHKNEKQRS